MKFLLPLFTTICLCLALNSQVTAQQSAKPRRASQKASQPRKESEDPAGDKVQKSEQHSPQSQSAASQSPAKNPLRRQSAKPENPLPKKLHRRHPPGLKFARAISGSLEANNYRMPSLTTFNG